LGEKEAGVLLRNSRLQSKLIPVNSVFPPILKDSIAPNTAGVIFLERRRNHRLLVGEFHVSL
jgi:hypothetical protein